MGEFIAPRRGAAKRGAVGEAWPPLFALDCTVASEVRESVAVTPYETRMRSGAPDSADSVRTSPSRPIHVLVDLIRGVYCSDSCRSPYRLKSTSIDARGFVGGSEERNLEWTAATSVSWSRVTGASDRSHTEQGTCRLTPAAPSRTAQ